MRKLFLLGFAAACMLSCNSNADSNTSGDSTSIMSGGSDTVSSGSSSGSMQGTGTDTGYHGAGMDSSRMSNMDTMGMRRSDSMK